MVVMQKNILLVQLFSKLQPPNAEPLAIEVLANSIIRTGIHDQIDLKVIGPKLSSGIKRDDFKGNLLINHNSLLGLSVPQGTLSLCCQILDELSASPSKKRPLVILGHAIPTYTPEFFLEKYPWVIIVRGWGETSFLKIVEQFREGKINLNNIPGISFSREGTIFHNNIDSFFQVSAPLRLDLKKYFARIETSRGCQYGGCTFCTRPPGARNFWQRLDIESIMSQIDELSRNNISYFTFTDEDFFGNDLAGAGKIAERLREVGNLHFSISLRADDIFNPSGTDYENNQRINILRTLRSAGLSRVFIGVESLSKTQLKRYGKGIILENSIKSVQKVKKLNIPVEVGYILFDPLLTVDELEENLKNLKITGLWKNVGMLFTRLRVQEASPYQVLLQRKELLTSFNHNMISYDWKFFDKNIDFAYSHCLDWMREFQLSYKLLQNLERSKINHNISKDYMYKFRGLDLFFFEKVVNSLISGSNSMKGISVLYKERHKLACNLRNALDKIALSNEEVLLLEELDNFLLVVKYTN